MTSPRTTHPEREGLFMSTTTSIVDIGEMRRILDANGFTINPTMTDKAVTGLALNAIMLSATKTEEGKIRLYTCDADENELKVFRKHEGSPRQSYLEISNSAEELQAWARQVSRITLRAKSVPAKA